MLSLLKGWSFGRNDFGSKIGLKWLGTKRPAPLISSSLVDSRIPNLKSLVLKVSKLAMFCLIKWTISEYVPVLSLYVWRILNLPPQYSTWIWNVAYTQSHACVVNWTFKFSTGARWLRSLIVDSSFKKKGEGQRNGIKILHPICLIIVTVHRIYVKVCNKQKH